MNFDNVITILVADGAGVNLDASAPTVPTAPTALAAPTTLVARSGLDQSKQTSIWEMTRRNEVRWSSD